MIIYIFLINFLTFITYGIDKYLAKKRLFRISEKLLFFLSFLGGVVGAFLGMVTFHHKTKKRKFWILNFLIFIFWLFLIFWVIIK